MPCIVLMVQNYVLIAPTLCSWKLSASHYTSVSLVELGHPLKSGAVPFSIPHRQIQRLSHIHHINILGDYFSLSPSFITLFHFPCFILHYILCRSSGELGLGELLSIITLVFDLGFVVCQKWIHLAHRNDEDKFPHFPLLGVKHFFRRETPSPIIIFHIQHDIHSSTSFAFHYNETELIIRHLSAFFLITLPLGGSPIF